MNRESLLSAYRAGRADRIAEVARQVSSGTYTEEDKLPAIVERMLGDVDCHNIERKEIEDEHRIE